MLSDGDGDDDDDDGPGSGHAADPALESRYGCVRLRVCRLRPHARAVQQPASSRALSRQDRGYGVLLYDVKSSAF